MTIADKVRELAKQTIDADQPTMRMFGTVQTLDPFTVQLNEKLVLPQGLLVLSQTVKNYIDWEVLEVGDKVIMTRQPGGQKYIVDDMVACDKDIREKMMQDHYHKYEDANVLWKHKKETTEGFMKE